MGAPGLKGNADAANRPSSYQIEIAIPSAGQAEEVLDLIQPLVEQRPVWRLDQLSAVILPPAQDLSLLLDRLEERVIGGRRCG